MEESEAQELLRGCAERDPEAWREFRKRYEKRLESGVRRGLRRSGAWRLAVEPEDLVQEVYCKLLDRGGRYLLNCRGRSEEAISAYLGRIAETVAIDRVRSEIAAKRGRGRVVAMPIRPTGEELDAIDPSMSPEQRLLAIETRVVFMQRCREVVGPRQPARDLRVLYLACVKGWPSRDIARALGKGLTPNSIDSVVHRARRRLEERGVPLPVRGQPLVSTDGREL